MILADPTDLVRTSSPAAEDWQDALRHAIRDPVELCRILRLPRHFEAAAVEASRQFPLFVPRSYIARMRPGDVRDPLLRQVLPLQDESADVAGFTRDPVGDMLSKKESGIIQKYHSRVLIITTGACGVHCRYCFRRHFPYSAVPRGPDDWSAWIAEIRRDPAIDEVILSGGDPLTLVDSQLARLAEMIAGVPHVRRLRIHTRMPIVIPTRVTSELIECLTGGPAVTRGRRALESSTRVDSQVQSALTARWRRRCFALESVGLASWCERRRGYACRPFPAVAGLPSSTLLSASIGSGCRRGTFRSSGRPRDSLIQQMRAQLPGTGYHVLRVRSLARRPNRC
jgi:KamA family protein